MKNAGILICLVVFVLSTLAHKTYAQTGSKKIGPKHLAYEDSLKTAPYKWTFPIWGKRLAKRGFELPLAGGIMLNPYMGSQEITISDLKVGLFGKDPVPLDFIKFGEVKATIQSVTVRPDLWILPFMDLYAIAGTTWSQTSVEVTDPMHFTTTANFFGYTYGVGTTLAGGFNGFVTIIDLNYTWSKIEEIKGTIQACMLTPRLGYNFRFKNRPHKSVTVWMGAPRIFLNRVTEGTIDIGNLGTTASQSQLQEMATGSPAWFSGLTPAQKEVMQTIAQKWIDKQDGTGTGDKDQITYSLVKKPVSKWSMCIGSQFQINPHWQVRTEIGLLGGRESLLISGNYRFGI